MFFAFSLLYAVLGVTVVVLLRRIAAAPSSCRRVADACRPSNIWIDLAALAALGGIVAYALLGGADFGGGVWDLFATGPRKRQQRLAIERAMGPVWEANHVWLIFVIVVLFTCFPRGYAALGIALFLPFHLALLGIMLRGASFVFRSYQSRQEDAAAETSGWGVVFGVASMISPVLLGMAFGVVTQGSIRLAEGDAIALAQPVAWLSPYAIANGLLALATCAYLAAVYLTNETDGELQDDFRRRAIVAGTATARPGRPGHAARLARGTAGSLAGCSATRTLPGHRPGPGLLRRLGLVGLHAALCAEPASSPRRDRACCCWAGAWPSIRTWPIPTCRWPRSPRRCRRCGSSSCRCPWAALCSIPSLWLLLRVFKSQV